MMNGACAIHLLRAVFEDGGQLILAQGIRLGDILCGTRL